MNPKPEAFRPYMEHKHRWQPVRAEGFSTHFQKTEWGKHTILPREKKILQPQPMQKLFIWPSEEWLINLKLHNSLWTPCGPVRAPAAHSDVPGVWNKTRSWGGQRDRSVWWITVRASSDCSTVQGDNLRWLGGGGHCGKKKKCTRGFGAKCFCRWRLLLWSKWDPSFLYDSVERHFSLVSAFKFIANRGDSFSREPFNTLACKVPTDEV